jgi:hypothetical protein
MWPDFFTQTYFTTAALFGILLVPDYPSFGSRWFWKSMIPIVAMHAVVLSVLLWVTLQFSGSDFKLPTRMVYGFVSVGVMIEWYVSLRIIGALRPK